MPQYNPDYDDDSEEDDPIRRMGFSDYQSSLDDEDEDTAAEAGSGAPGVNRPLTAGELIALMTADKDPNSDYKLSIERLQSLNYSNLSGEELDIVS